MIPVVKAPDKMTGRDWFIVGARLLGLWLIASSAGNVANYLNIRLDYVSQYGGFSPESYLVHSAVDGVLAGYLLLGTDWIANLCYGPRAQIDGSQDASLQESDVKTIEGD